MAGSFSAGGLTKELRILPGIVVLGVAIGFVCAKSRLPGVLAHSLSLVLGFAICFLMLSTRVRLPMDVTAAGGALGMLQAKGAYMAERLSEWIAAAQQGEMSNDSLPFAMQMAALSWLIAFYGAWSLFRSHWVWGAILPAGLATFLSVYYAPPRLMIYFVALLLWAWLLLVRMHVYQREEQWQHERIVYDRMIGLDFLRDGALLSLAVIALVWLVPRPEGAHRLGDVWSGLQGPWQRVQQEWSRLYASLAYDDQSGLTTFGSTLTLGGPLRLSAAPLMEVQAVAGRYWRAVVVDRYTGTGWIDTTPSSLIRVDASAALGNGVGYAARDVLTQTVTFVRPGETLLFAAGEPWRVHVPTRVQAMQSAGIGLDVSAIYAPGLGHDNRYVVESLVSVADEQSLRQAGTTYPTWVAERYLQLPAALPSRVFTLAREVAGDQPTPYDQAVAIQSYLRRLRYNQEVDAPPSGRDAVDWFLFDSREGYCTYFASAMAIMCRSLGLPARVAQGYAQGEWVAERQVFVVREHDAHAWPEVYFPGYGWIDFEPTPSQPLLQRPATSGSNVAGLPLPLPAAPGPQGRQATPGPGGAEEGAGNVAGPGSLLWSRLSSRIVLGVVVFCLFTVAGVAAYVASRWRALQPVERLYLRLTWVAGLLGVGVRPCQTPIEFGRALSEALGPGGAAAGEIVRLYTRQRFGRREASAGELAAAQQAWWTLLPIAARRALAIWRANAGARHSYEHTSWTELRPH